MKSGTELHIREITEEDVRELSITLAPNVSTQQINQRWQEHKEGYRQMLVALVDGKAVGTVSIGGHGHQVPNSLRMFALDVGHGYRRRGIGSALIAAVEERGRSLGISYCNLEVEVGNSNAIRLYRRLGYEQFGEPFVNRWYRIDDKGMQQEVEEHSFVLRKQLK